jgi:hypothetical protein
MIMLVVACKSGGGDSGWIEAKRTEVSGTVEGVAFTLQIPEGFVPDSALPSGSVGWKDKADTTGFSVSVADAPITSVEAAVAAGSLPDDHSTIEKQTAIADGFVVRRTSGKGVAFSDVFKTHPGGTIQCHAGATAPGAKDIADMPALLSAMEAVCASLTVK